MRFRFSALLCLAGLAGCSQTTNPSTAQEPVYGNEPAQATTEPTMKPASFEEAPRTRTTPASDEARTATNAPLVGDTNGARPDAVRTQDDHEKPQNRHLAPFNRTTPRSINATRTLPR